eukprot:scaffold125462_cov69-Phaeocystis_antarctica.AAC.1
MLLAAYNTEVALVGLRRNVRTLGRWDLALGSGAEGGRLRAPAVRAAEGGRAADALEATCNSESCRCPGWVDVYLNLSSSPEGVDTPELLVPRITAPWVCAASNASQPHPGPVKFDHAQAQKAAVQEFERQFAKARAAQEVPTNAALQFGQQFEQTTPML